MKIYLGADHRGFELKEEIKQRLLTNYEVVDLGNEVFNKDDDFTDYVKRVAEQISQTPIEKGIVFCGSGAGAEITANKIDNVRASLGINPEQTKNARADDNINILVIAADYTDFENTKSIIKVFLQTEFISSEKHLRRLEKIKDLES